MTNDDYFALIAPLTHTDAYKLDHRRQYPEGTEYVLSNYTNRKSRLANITHVVHFGLQAFLQSWATDAWEPFFEADADEVADLYEEFTASILGPEASAEIGSDHIRALHHKGYLPLRFSALPEGTLVPIRVPSFTVENTDPEFFWLVNYIESVMSAEVWQPSTTATTAHYFRELLDHWAVKTTGSTDGVAFQGHDFSFRGMPGERAAAASAAGHLLSFTGSDSLSAINYVDHNYFGQNGLVLGSVPATEHSVMCAGGSDEGEEQATYERLLKLYPTGIVSVVSDTWDLWNVLTNILPNLKDQIMGREGKLVIRPDSGDPVDILTGTIEGPSNAPSSPRPDGDAWDVLPAEKGVVELLWDVFGGTVNEQGYKVLDPHIGSIYGDSITYERAAEIFARLEAKGFASTNVVMGIGSYSYQYVTRDTFSSAIKATWVQINGEGRDIFKNPVTDSGMKKSAKGRLAVIRNEETGELELFDSKIGADIEASGDSLLKPVWEDGQPLVHQSFEQVREVLASERTY